MRRAVGGPRSAGIKAGGGDLSALVGAQACHWVPWPIPRRIGRRRTRQTFPGRSPLPHEQRHGRWSRRTDRRGHSIGSRPAHHSRRETRHSACTHGGCQHCCCQECRGFTAPDRDGEPSAEGRGRPSLCQDRRAGPRCRHSPTASNANARPKHTPTSASTRLRGHCGWVRPTVHTVHANTNATQPNMVSGWTGSRIGLAVGVSEGLPAHYRTRNEHHDDHSDPRAGTSQISVPRVIDSAVTATHGGHGRIHR